MPSAASARLGLTSPLGTEAAAGPANIATLITQLEASVAMARLSEQTSGGGAGAGLTFAAINQNFRHLRIEGVIRSNSTLPGGTDALAARFNGSSAAVYDARRWRAAAGAAGGADGAGIDDTPTIGATSADLGFVGTELTAGDVPASVTGFCLDVFDYTAASIWKTWLCRSVRTTVAGSNGVEVAHAGGAWRATAAITDVSLFLASASGMDAVSRATLYGLR